LFSFCANAVVENIRINNIEYKRYFIFFVFIVLTNKIIF